MSNEQNEIRDDVVLLIQEIIKEFKKVRNERDKLRKKLKAIVDAKDKLIEPTSPELLRAIDKARTPKVGILHGTNYLARGENEKQL